MPPRHLMTNADREIAKLKPAYWPPERLSAYDELQKAEADSRKTVFLDCLSGARTGVPMLVREACETVGVTRTTVAHWRKDGAFAVAFDTAYQDGMDRVEEEAMRRAVKGDEQEIFNKDGEVVATKRVYSDRLMERILEARRSELYSRNAGVVVNNLTQVSTGPTDHDIAKALALMIEEAAIEKEAGA